MAEKADHHRGDGGGRTAVTMNQQVVFALLAMNGAALCVMQVVRGKTAWACLDAVMCVGFALWSISCMVRGIR